MNDYGSPPADHASTPAGYRTQFAEIEGRMKSTSRELAMALAEQMAQMEIMRLQARQQENPHSGMSLVERIERIENVLGINHQEGSE